MSESSKNTEAPRLADRLLAALGSIDRPSEVCVSGDRPMLMPGLEVDGLGTIGLPLAEAQAKRLTKLAHQAPYGKGTQTLVDTSVRRVWELDPGQFHLTNPKWPTLVTSVLDQVKEELGLHGQELVAHLYKLLVYEKGGFFLSHRDGEKHDRMVATLVLTLPSEHEGGELVVRHEGQERIVTFPGAASGYELSFAAFYADCEHEVKPLRVGYRLSLVYNVCLAKKRGKRELGAPSASAATHALASVLGEWVSNPVPEKLAVTLDHRYTQDGLTIEALKGTDRLRAEALFEAAERAGCTAHLALLTLHQVGASHEAFGMDAYSWSDADGDDEPPGDLDIDEIIDEEQSATHWSDRQGERVDLGAIGFDDEEIVAPEHLMDTLPSREEFEGYTGNAGMTLARWYHRAVVAIWPAARHFEILCQAGTDSAIGGLASFARNLRKMPKKQQVLRRQECIDFAATIIDTWGRRGSSYLLTVTGREDRSPFLDTVCDLDDAALLDRVLREIMPKAGNVAAGPSFAAACKRHGWQEFEEPLVLLMKEPSEYVVARNVELLRLLCTQRDKQAARVRLCRTLAEPAFRAIVACDKGKRGRHRSYWDIDRKTMLVSFVSALLAVDANETLAGFIDYILGSDSYDLTALHLAAIFALAPRITKLREPRPALDKWLATCRARLEERVATPPAKPKDYRRKSRLSCRCADCKMLAAFLKSPTEAEARFAINQERRCHVASTIEDDEVDCTYTTIERGSPYVLLCTKTTASYERACGIYQRDCDNLERLVGLQRRMGGAV